MFLFQNNLIVMSSFVVIIKFKSINFFNHCEKIDQKSSDSKQFIQIEHKNMIQS